MRAGPSRLTSPSGAIEPAPRRVAGHAARDIGGGVLLTSDSGEWSILSAEDYVRYLAGRVTDEEPLGRELAAKDLIRDRLDFARLGAHAASRQLLSWPGPSVHTVVVTRRCNYKCLYCHASVVGPDEPGVDMTVGVARRVVDLIFQTPNPEIMIEFQGGEPLLNWPIVRFVVEYARLKNRAAGKTLRFGLVSNFSLLDEEKVDWLIAHGVSFCTSLDGPAELHEGNRIWSGGSAHASVLAGLRLVLDRKRAGARVDTPNAICTVSRQSFPFWKEIVDQAVALGLERVQLGPLDPVGFARRHWDRVGYEPEEFVEFYGKALDYLIELNRRGVKAYEKMSLILLIRILKGEHWRFPNAEAVARLAYDWDGAVYTGEDGRLLAADGNPFFHIGRVADARLPALLEHPTVRVSLLSALPQAQPMCSQCAYAPFCTVQPTFNVATQDSPWGRMPENRWCRTIMGVFDLLFTRLRDPDARKVLESWLEYQDR